jgi:hypothetical protein
MQLDIYLPKENLALEYQGQHHYSEINHFGSQWRFAERDLQKKKACENVGITLIEIPYWWNFKKESLLATIHSKRPELVAQPYGLPIPSFNQFKM